MNLATYLRQQKETREAFAARVGVHPITVTRWVTGSLRPGWDKLAVIERITAGEVTAQDFVPKEPVS